jgi:hypothetical protein
MICLLEQKICSGDYPRSGSYSTNINKTFFDGKEPPNDNFSRMIDKSDKGSIRLPIDKILENSTGSDLEDLIYVDSSNKEHNGKTLYFAVARNLAVERGVRLDVSMTVQVCKAGVAKPTVETFEQESKVIHEGPTND